MSKSLNDMTDKEQQLETASGVGLRANLSGPETRFFVTLEAPEPIEWGPECFDEIADEILGYELEENNLQLTRETTVASVAAAFANFVQIAFPRFTKRGYKWAGNDASDPIVEAARIFFPWKWKNKADIEEHLTHCRKNISAIHKQLKGRREFAKEIYTTLFFLETWVKDATPPKLIKGKQPGKKVAFKREKAVSVIPSYYQAPVNDNQVMNKFITAKLGEEFLIPIKRVQRSKLPKANLYAKQTAKTKDALRESDWYVAAAFIEIAQHNVSTNLTGSIRVPTVTMRELVSFVSGIRLDNVTPDNSFYKFVSASLLRLKGNRFDYSYKDLFESGRAEEREGFISSRDDAPLLDFSTGEVDKGGKIEKAMFFNNSFAFEILDLLGLRHTIPMNSLYIPPNLRGEDQIAAFFDMFLRALNHGKHADQVNMVELYAGNNPRKNTLFKSMKSYGWIDISTLKRTPTTDEKNADKAQRAFVTKVLDHWAKHCPNISVYRDDLDPEKNGEKEGLKRLRKITCYWAKFDRDANKPKLRKTRKPEDTKKLEHKQ